MEVSGVSAAGAAVVRGHGRVRAVCGR